MTNHKCNSTKEERVLFFQSGIDESILDEIKKASNLVVTSDTRKRQNEKELQKMFKQPMSLQERNAKIYKVYKNGYSQYKIATVLALSQPTVNRIIKRLREF